MSSMINADKKLEEALETLTRLTSMIADLNESTTVIVASLTSQLKALDRTADTEEKLS